MGTSVKAEVLTFCSSGAFRCVLTQWEGEKTLAAIVGEVHHFIVRTSSFKTAANLYRSGPPPTVPDSTIIIIKYGLFGKWRP